MRDNNIKFDANNHYVSEVIAVKLRICCSYYVVNLSMWVDCRCLMMTDIIFTDSLLSFIALVQRQLLVFNLSVNDQSHVTTLQKFNWSTDKSNVNECRVLHLTSISPKVQTADSQVYGL